MNTNKRSKEIHRINNGITERMCTDCFEWKPETTEYFYMMNKSKPEKGYTSKCKQCSAKRARKWTLKNPEKAQASWDKREAYPERKEYHRKHGREQKASGYFAEYLKRPEVKARQYTKNHRIHDISTKEWESCKDYFDNSCAYCGLPIEEHYITFRGEVRLSDLHREHVDDSGANDLSNCVPACKECNSSKWLFNFEEWYKQQEFYSEDKYNKIIKWITEDYKKYIEEKLPYKIIKKKNEDNKTFHYELWTVDKFRNPIECISKANKRDLLDLSLVDESA